MEAFMPTPSLSYLIGEAVVRYSNSRRRELRKLTGLKLSEGEARAAWPRLLEHKWYLSERLGRDVGLRVAALDYFENVRLPRHSRVGHEARPHVPSRAAHAQRLPA